VIEFPFRPSLGRCKEPIPPTFTERVHGLRNDYVFCQCPNPQPSTVRWFGFITGECATCKHPIEKEIA
jgi:hypothetical protein